MEPVYTPVIAVARALFAAQGLKFTITGSEHFPRQGGAVLVMNHVGYFDFAYAGLAAHPSGRLVRFMAKEQVFHHKVSGPLMRGMHHIPVDREFGLASYRAALAALSAGEVVGIFPEATISQSFTVKETKSGAARLAAAAGVPLIPVALWGGQRLWTKGHKRTLTKRHVPVLIRVGEPMRPGRRDDHDAVNAELRARLSHLLEQEQQDYPDKPAGEHDTWWQPAYLGGSAPQPATAD
jgi:1-acyl-sn-glycerol-3-phosphate acyltransferase